MGIKKTKYEVFKDLKKRVIDVAINEINNLSPVKLKVEIDKKIKQIRFILIKEQLSDSILIEENGLKSTLIEIFNLSETVSNEVIEKYGIEYIQKKTHMIINSVSFKVGNIKHVSGYLLDALAKDYQSAVSSGTVLVNRHPNRAIPSPL